MLRPVDLLNEVHTSSKVKELSSRQVCDSNLEVLLNDAVIPSSSRTAIRNHIKIILNGEEGLRVENIEL